MARELQIVLDGFGTLEVENGESFLLNSQFIDLNNPTAINNTYTKTIQIPATVNNNKVLQHIWNFSYRVYDFDPSKRVNCHVLIDGEEFTSGYIKLESISIKNNIPQSYNITIYGGIGNFFYELSEKNLDDLNVNTSLYNHNINRQTVINSWTNENYRYPLTYSGLYDNFDSDKVFRSFDTDFIDGARDIVYNPELDKFVLLFADEETAYFGLYSAGSTQMEIVRPNIDIFGTPVRLRWDRFNNRYFCICISSMYIYWTESSDLQTWQSKNINPSGSTALVRDVAPGQLYPSTGLLLLDNRARLHLIDSSLAASPGTSGWEIRSFAGSTQYMALYSTIELNEWSSVQLSGIITGYAADNSIVQFDIDSTGYNFRTVQVQNAYQVGTGTALNANGQQYMSVTQNGDIYIGQQTSFGQNISFTKNNSMNATLRYSKSSPRNAGGISYVGGTKQIGTLNTSGSLTVYNYTQNINIISVAFNGQVQNQQYVISWIDVATGEYKLSTTSNLSSQPSTWTTISGYYSELELDRDLNEHDRNEFRSYYQRPMIRLKNIFTQILEDSSYNYTLDPVFFSTTNPYWQNTWILLQRLQYDGVIPNDHVGNIRSNDSVTFRSIIKKDVTQLSFLTSFTKMFRLIFDIDELTKTVSILTPDTFFANPRILQYDEKINTGEDMTLTPLTFSNKYLVFKYEETGSYYEDLYKENYNRFYGQTYVDTGYEFNNSELDMIPNLIFQNLIMSQEYSRFFIDRNPSNEYADDKVLPALFTRSGKDMKYNDSSMHIVFCDGVTQLNTPAYISDDNSDMLNYGLFMWNDSSSERTQVTSYPNVRRLFDANNSLDFGRPQDFYYPVGDYQPKATIYYSWWERFINEIYNINNKKLSTKIYLNIVDMNRFKHNTFIVFYSVLWFVNNIQDYNINGDNTTNVELIKVYDLEAYRDRENFHLSVSQENIIVPFDTQEIELNIKSSHSYTIKKQ